MNKISYTEEEKISNLLLWHSVVKVDDDTLMLDNGTKLVIYSNEGCGGCNNGWFDIDELNDCPNNAITAVEFQHKIDGDNRYDPVETFRIFVYAADERIKLLEMSGYDNGYYGVGYWIEVTASDGVH